MVAQGRSIGEQRLLTFSRLFVAMIQRLTNTALLESAYQQVASVFRQHAEWLYAVADEPAQSLRRDEIEISIISERLVLSCWTDNGNRLWRVLAWHWSGELLTLQVSRRMGAELSVIEFIPRTSAKAVTATIRAAREIRCERLAQLAATFTMETAIERFALSRGTRPGQPGRYAQILLNENRNGSRSLAQWSKVIQPRSMRLFHQRCCGSDEQRIASSRRTFSNSG
jgi:hypothetical protein